MATKNKKYKNLYCWHTLGKVRLSHSRNDSHEGRHISLILKIFEHKLNRLKLMPGDWEYILGY